MGDWLLDSIHNPTDIMHYAGSGRVDHYGDGSYRLFTIDFDFGMLAASEARSEGLPYTLQDAEVMEILLGHGRVGLCRREVFHLLKRYIETGERPWGK